MFLSLPPSCAPIRPQWRESAHKRLPAPGDGKGANHEGDLLKKKTTTRCRGPVPMNLVQQVWVRAGAPAVQTSIRETWVVCQVWEAPA